MGNRGRLLVLALCFTSNNSNGALSELLGGESNDVNHVIIQTWLLPALTVINHNFKREGGGLWTDLLSWFLCSDICDVKGENTVNLTDAASGIYITIGFFLRVSFKSSTWNRNKNCKTFKGKFWLCSLARKWRWANSRYGLFGPLHHISTLSHWRGAGSAAHWNTTGCRQTPRFSRETNLQPERVCVCQWLMTFPLSARRQHGTKSLSRVKQRPSNCAFEQAAWSVSWWLVGPPGPAVPEIGWGLGWWTGRKLGKRRAFVCFQRTETGVCTVPSRNTSAGYSWIIYADRKNTPSVKFAQRKQDRDAVCFVRMRSNTPAVVSHYLGCNGWSSREKFASLSYDLRIRWSSVCNSRSGREKNESYLWIMAHISGGKTAPRPKMENT